MSFTLVELPPDKVPGSIPGSNNCFCPLGKCEYIVDVEKWVVIGCRAAWDRTGRNFAGGKTPGKLPMCKAKLNEQRKTQEGE